VTTMAALQLAHRDRVKTLLAFALESRLTGATASGAGFDRTDSPWDAWWICYRTAASADDLCLDPLPAGGSCAQCCRDVLALIATNPPGHPDSLGPRACSCMPEWAQRMRVAAPDPPWPAVRTTVAMVKPGADAEAIRRGLRESHVIVTAVERALTTADVRRLYPDAYGAEYIAAQDTYLTIAPVQVLVLVAQPWTAAQAKQIKTRLREHLGTGDPLRNHLHMPDNPGDALCDVQHFAGPDLLRDLYERYDSDGSTRRLLGYRAALARR